MKIALVDSGAGGLSLIPAMKQRLPHADIIYGNDNANFPYGTKTEQDVTTCILKIVEAIRAQDPFDALVVGCNTASTVALPALREAYAFPVVGVVPAIKPAAELSQTKHIGLLATEGTVKRAYTHDLVKEFASSCQVTMIGNNELVAMAEVKLRNQPPNRNHLKKILSPFITATDIDVVVLGCTHFPFLLEDLKESFDRPCQWLDSGEAIARRCHEVLPATEPTARNGSLTAYFTANNLSSEALQPYIRSMGFTRTRYC